MHYKDFMALSSEARQNLLELELKSGRLHLQNEETTSFLQTLAECRNLQKLDLSDNDFDRWEQSRSKYQDDSTKEEIKSSNLKEFSKVLSQLKTLQELHLCNCGFIVAGENSFFEKVLCESIPCLPNLKKLNLNGNSQLFPMHLPGIILFCKGISESNVEELDISDCGFEFHSTNEKVCQQLKDAITTSKTLTTVHLTSETLARKPETEKLLQNINKILKEKSQALKKNSIFPTITFAWNNTYRPTTKEKREGEEESINPPSSKWNTCSLI